MSYLSASSLKDAFDALGSGTPSIIAGGTDWYPAQGERAVTCDILDITRIDDLRGISMTADGWRIGAACKWSDIIKADLPAAFDGLKSAAREVGSVQIQNAGTIAGNLCNASPAADGVPPLLALDAQVEIGSSAGLRSLPLASFITDVRQTALEASEMVTAIIVPQPNVAQRSTFVKLGARKYLVISIAMIAVNWQVEDGLLRDLRIAVGACSSVAQRLAALEAALEGQGIDKIDALLERADLSPLSPIDDVRGSGSYRLDVVASLISRALKEAING